MQGTFDRAGTPDSAVKSGLHKIERRSLRDIAVSLIRTGILNGELKPGERITEGGLATKLGVGQPTVREALIELEHQGFVRRKGIRKTFITDLTQAEIHDIYKVRTRLEILAVELLSATQGAGTEVCERQCRRMVDGAKQVDTYEFYAADLDFHRGLWIATENQALVDVLDLLVPKLFAFGIIRHAAVTGEGLLKGAELHCSILKHIRIGDSETACQLMERSMEQAWLDDATLTQENSA